MDTLFTSYEEFISFCNLKAKLRLISLENDIDSYDAELKSALDKCDVIFEKYGIDENYISKIIEVEGKFQSPSGVMYGSSEIDALNGEKEKLRAKYDEFLSKLPLAEREDLEFLARQIENRKSRVLEASNTINEIEKVYPDARSVDIKEAFASQRILIDIADFLKPNAREVEKPKSVRPMPYVVKIVSAPKSLLELTDGDHYEESMEFNEPVKNAALESDNSFFDDKNDDLVTSIENDVIVPLFTEAKKEETVKLDGEKKNTYTMYDGDTLKSIALTVCGDENGWYDIYSANKNIIDQRIAENDINPEAIFFEDDKSILTGLTIVIPNTYRKDAQKEYSIAA